MIFLMKQVNYKIKRTGGRMITVILAGIIGDDFGGELDRWSHFKETK